MPSRRYHRNKVKRLRDPPAYYINQHSNCPDYNEVNNSIVTFQAYICDIVKIITNEIDIADIRKKAMFIINTINSKMDVFNTLDLMESYMCSIVDNIERCIDINIIKCRIEYIRNIIDTLPDSYNDYGEFAPMLYQLLEAVTNNLDMKKFINKMNTFKKSITDDVEALDKITEIEVMIISIVNNIERCIDINIIRCRILFLQNLIKNLDCDSI
jgi:hypothetical protein